MARKKVPRALPRLPKKAALARALYKTDRLVDILRDVALKNRGKQPRAFYAVREVAKSYGVPLSTVARAYRRLEQEGLLTRVRGSRTLLQGLHYDRRFGIRGLVGLPASLSSFVTVQAYRMFFIKIRRELRLRGFATAMVFVEKGEARSPALSERFKSYEVDTLIWFQPPRDAVQSVLWLTDFGIRVVGIAHEDFPGIPCRYHVRRDHAIAQLLAQWKETASIVHVTLARPEEERPSVVEEAVRNALDDLSLASTVVRFNGKRSETFLRALQKAKPGGVIFSSARLASKLCFQAPNSMSDLLERRRVAFLNGPISMPFMEVPDVHVDLVVVDWQRVAEQIVHELVTQEAFQSTGPTIFEAEAKLRVPLSAFAQTI
jgi:DNA-binding LacI/PurR family transcriptional regulator